MTLVDANLLLYATNTGSRFHELARTWLSERLAGATRVGLPWSGLAAFLRIATTAPIYDRPLDPETAWSQVEDWLASDVAWIPTPAHGTPSCSVRS